MHLSICKVYYHEKRELSRVFLKQMIDNLKTPPMVAFFYSWSKVNSKAPINSFKNTFASSKFNSAIRSFVERSASLNSIFPAFHSSMHFINALNLSAALTSGNKSLSLSPVKALMNSDFKSSGSIETSLSVAEASISLYASRIFSL